MCCVVDGVCARSSHCHTECSNSSVVLQVLGCGNGDRAAAQQLKRDRVSGPPSAWHQLLQDPVLSPLVAAPLPSRRPHSPTAACLTPCDFHARSSMPPCPVSLHQDSQPQVFFSIGFGSPAPRLGPLPGVNIGSWMKPKDGTLFLQHHLLPYAPNWNSWQSIFLFFYL